MKYMSGSSGYGGDFLNNTAHGAGRWLKPEEYNALGCGDYRPDSIVLGQNRKGELTYLNQQGHITVLAPPRTGKGVGFVQANLIGYQGSMLCNDPKGENAAVSYWYRRNVLGHQVIVLDPAGKLESYRLPDPIPTQAYNPYEVFDNPDAAEVLDYIGLMADALLVTKGDPREDHWRDGARNCLIAWITYQVFFLPMEHRNLIMLSRLANGLEITHDDLCIALVHNGHPDPLIADVIAKAGGFWDKVNPKERSGFVSMALRSLAWLNNPIWHKQLTRSEFRPSDLKDGKTTVYLVCPFEKLEQFAPWFRVCLTACIIAILRTPKRCDIPILLMLDEFAACIGRLAALEQGLPYLEGMGCRAAMIFQYLSQMAKLWPEPEYHGVFASAGVHLFFNINDKFTSEYVSNYIGKYGAMSPSPGGMGFVARDVLTPDEIRTFPPNDLIAFIRGQRPAWLGKLNVRHHPAFKGLLKPNPAYEIAPSVPKALIGKAQPVLSAAEALNRAKQKPSVSLALLTSALEDKYPGKNLRLDGDLCGYDQTRTNPQTGETESFFTPIIHTSLLETLAKGGPHADATSNHD